MLERKDLRALIVRYLEAMQSGDVATVRRLSAEGARLQYPGGVEFDSPEALLAWSAGRHLWVRHDIEHIDSMAVEDESIVYVTGTLAGAWGDGELFGGIRFIYRFRVRLGHVRDTRLWSDVAEAVRLRAQRLAAAAALESRE